jgi:hypothetical protein
MPPRGICCKTGDLVERCCPAQLLRFGESPRCVLCPPRCGVATLHVRARPQATDHRRGAVSIGLPPNRSAIANLHGITEKKTEKLLSEVSTGEEGQKLRCGYTACRSVISCNYFPIPHPCSLP